MTACATSPVQQVHDGAVDAGDAGVPAACGNRQIDPGEACDDGNLLDGDGCGPACQIESGWVCSGEPSVCVSLCGNGSLDPGEACDGNLLDGQDCTTVPGGFTGGILTCSAYCTFETGGCISAGCGNQILDPGEQCDDGNTVAGDGCNANCQVEAGWTCSGVPSVCTILCGNGQRDPGEACDGGQLGGETCATVPGGFTGGTLRCAADCTFDTSACTTCGNGIQEAGEACDDGNATAGDGCDPSCQVEALPVLSWATGDPAVWGQMTITYALDPHAPSAPIVAAANADQRGYAYVFTATTYHRLSLPGHQWIAHGPLSALFPQVPAGQLRAAAGISWPSDDHTAIILVTVSGGTATGWIFNEDNATGQVTLAPGWPAPIDWSADPNAPPSPASMKAAFETLDNANGWTHADMATVCQNADPPPNPYPAPGTDVGPYMGIITQSNDLFFYDAGYCWVFYDSTPLGSFPPFTAAGAPQAADVVAAFYTTAHGNRLYVITQP